MSYVCRSRQCQISALTQAGGGGLLLRFSCSVALRGGRGAANKRHWPVWGALQCSCHTGFAPAHRVCFPLYTAQALGCSIWSRPCVACGSSFRVLHKSEDSVGPAFCAFPTRVAQATRSLTNTLSPGAGRLLPSTVPGSVSAGAGSGVPCVCSWELVFSRNPPGRCQPSRISESLWLETGSLFAVW